MAFNLMIGFSGPGLTGLGVLLLSVGAGAMHTRAEVLSLSFPLECRLGESCFIQNYTDSDPGPGVKDYRCGKATYDGHKGTDFRLTSIRDAIKGVSVLAASGGTVRAVRDGVKDHLYQRAIKPEFEAGQECGNGVVIDHGEGWVTQYCHMRQGSVRVKRGQVIKRQEQLGLAGFSGKAQFAHLHLSVRYKGQVIDPFSGHVPDGKCGSASPDGLWEGGVASAPEYRTGEIVEVGFSDGPVNTLDLEKGAIAQRAASIDSAAMVFFSRHINLMKGDRLQLTLWGPAGLLAKNTTKSFARHKAQFVAFVGLKRKTQSWPAGQYKGEIKLIRTGKVVLERKAIMDLFSKP